MKKKVIALLAVFGAVLLTLSACGDSGEAIYRPYNGDFLTSKVGSGDKEIQQISAEDRKLITTLEYSLESEDYDADIEAIKALVVDYQGYIERSDVNQNSYGEEQYRYATFVLRIPADKRTEFQNDLSGIGHLINVTESMDDVTLTYSDIANKVKALETKRDSLISMLESAETLDDILKIQNYLSECETELENYKSRMLYYDNQIDYCSVYIYLCEVKKFSPEDHTLWERIRTEFQESLEGVGNFFEGLAVFLIGDLPGILAFLVIAGLIVTWIIFLVRFWRKKEAARRKGNKEKAKEKETEEQSRS